MKKSDLKEPVAIQLSVAITFLSQLEQLSNGAPVVVVVAIRGTPVQFTGRRLKPQESKEVKILLESAMPPILPPDQARPRE
jgi:hypothetical protein